MLSPLFKAGLDAITTSINMSFGPWSHKRNFLATAEMFQILLEEGEEAAQDDICQYIESKGFDLDTGLEIQHVYEAMWISRHPQPGGWAPNILDLLREKAAQSRE